MVPNKVFQGAAAGCAVVTSDTAPQRRVLGDAAVLVPPGDPAALAEALRSLAADRLAAGGGPVGCRPRSRTVVHPRRRHGTAARAPARRRTPEDLMTARSHGRRSPR